MMKRLLMIILLMCLLLVGCQQQEPDPDAVDLAACETIPVEDVQALPVINNAPIGASYALSTHVPTDEGVFLLKMTEIDGGWSFEKAFLYYDDFASGELYPVCTKSNCTHDSYDCHAYLPNAQNLYYDGESLYYFTGTQPSLWRMDPDGTDRKLVFTVTEEENGLPMLTNTVYAEGKVYFCYYGALVNPETLELESSEYICMGDLNTGELTVLPIRFQQEKDSSTLSLLGVYGDQLLLRHSIMITERFSFQQYQETLFLLDANTCEVKVIARWTWDTGDDDSEISFEPPQKNGLLILRRQTSPSVACTYADGSKAIVYGGDRLLVDMAEGKAYRVSGLDDLSTLERIIDGRLLLKHWSEDRSHVTEYVLDLSTGEELPNLWEPGVTDVVNYDCAAGDYYLVYNYEDNGLPRQGKIKKEAYWAGNVDAIAYYPDWVVIS